MKREKRRGGKTTEIEQQFERHSRDARKQEETQIRKEREAERMV